MCQIRLFRRLLPALLPVAQLAAAANPPEVEQCLLRQLAFAPPETTIAELRERCGVDVLQRPRVAAPAAGTAPTAPPQTTSVVGERISLERATRGNPFVITPHRPNYVLPVTYSVNPNAEPFGGTEGSLNKAEMKFQLSVKTVVAQDLFNGRGALFFAYTNQSWWQAYSRRFSSPFRETNHEPEVFLTYLNNWRILGFDNRLLRVGLSHQSNGRSGTLSRSWNRLYADIVLERGPLVLSIKPWYRIPEDEKQGLNDPTGDDNPDIDEYLGYGELRFLYKRKRHTLSGMFRHNLRREGHGAVEINYSFPFSPKIRGYAQIFNGYGESLIDYNAPITRIGVGVALTDWL